MEAFPPPLPLPQQIARTRSQRSKQIVKATSIGIAIRLLIIAIEFLGFWHFNSSALLLDAISNSSDALSSIALLIFITLVARPPDTNHPFGHGRYEPLAGLQLGIVLALVGGGMLVQQSLQFASIKQHSPLDTYAWICPALSIFLLELSYQIFIRAARKAKSTALAAEALHYRIDSISSSIALCVLLLGSHLPLYSILFDHLGAIAITILMISLGCYAAYQNLHQLLDRMPDKDYFEKVRTAAFHAFGVLGVEKIHVQLYGPDAHVNIDIEVDPDLSVKKAHEISQNVRYEIQKEWPAVRNVVVHIEPYYPHDH